MRDVESFADFIQYYSNSFVKSRVDGNVMYYVTGGAGVGRGTAIVTKYVGGVMGAPAMMSEASINETFSWGVPLVGMTVLKDRELMYVYYRTARTGCRGFSSERIVSHSFNGRILRQHGLMPADAQWFTTGDGAWQALSQPRVGLDVAWTDLTSKVPQRLAYALSYKFGVYLGEDEYPVLCHKMSAIGKMLSPTKVQLSEKFREIKDLVVRVLNPQMEIEIV